MIELKSFVLDYVNKLKKKIAPKKLLKYENLMKEHSGKTIFLLRFIIGLRFLSPLTAGSMHIKWEKFALYDFIAVLIFAPIFILLGFHFTKLLTLIINKVIVIKEIVILIVSLIIVFSIIEVIRKKMKKKED